MFSLRSSDSLLLSCRMFCSFQAAAEVVTETNRFLRKKSETSGQEPTRLCYTPRLFYFQNNLFTAVLRDLCVKGAQVCVSYQQWHVLVDHFIQV